jgi:hypothetical protein
MGGGNSKQSKCLVVGLDNSGKSTIINHLKPDTKKVSSARGTQRRRQHASLETYTTSLGPSGEESLQFSAATLAPLSPSLLGFHPGTQWIHCLFCFHCIIPVPSAGHRVGCNSRFSRREIQAWKCKFFSFARKPQINTATWTSDSMELISDLMRIFVLGIESLRVRM